MKTLRRFTIEARLPGRAAFLQTIAATSPRAAHRVRDWLLAAGVFVSVDIYNRRTSREASQRVLRDCYPTVTVR